jgi:hypothetical protein
MSTSFDSKIVLESPIFGIDYIGNFIVAICGGGGQKFGVKNYLLSYQIKKDKIAKDPIYKLDYGDKLAIFIKSMNKNNIFIVCFDTCSITYSIDLGTGVVIELSKYDNLSNLSRVYFDTKDENMICGDMKGEIR